jgi:hypothetical protein
MVSMLRVHVMSYIDSVKFLNNPEKAWSEKVAQKRKSDQMQLQFSSA